MRACSSEDHLKQLTGFVELPPELRGLAALHDAVHAHMDTSRFGASFSSIAEAAPAATPASTPAAHVERDVERMTMQVGCHECVTTTGRPRDDHGTTTGRPRDDCVTTSG